MAHAVAIFLVTTEENQPQPDPHDAPRSKRSVKSEELTPASFGRLALVAGVVFALICFVALLKSGVPYRTAPLDGWSIDNPNFLGLGTRVRGVELKSTPLTTGGVLHEVDLIEVPAVVATNPLPTVDLHSVALRFDVRTETKPIDPDLMPTTIRRAQLELRSGSNTLVRLEAKEYSKLSTEGRLELLRTSPPRARTSSSNDVWVLNVVTEPNIRLFLRANVSEPGRLTEPYPGGGRLVIPLAPTAKGLSFAYPIGDFTQDTPGPPASRVALLAYLWQMEHKRDLYFWVLLAAAMFGAGTLLFPWQASMESEYLSDAAKAGLGAALLFAALGLIQLIVTPPLFGTDEPAHVLSYHLWMSDNDAADRTAELGRRNHAIRMLWRPAQKFTTADMNNPYKRFVDSPNTMYTRPGARSASALAMWRVSQRFVFGNSAANMIFRLRLVSLASVAGCVGLAAALLAGTGAAGAPTGWIGLGLLLVPSLPYYAMNVSNYPLVLGAGILVAAAVGALINQSAVSGWIGLYLGAGASLAFFSSASCWPLAAIVLCAVTALALRRLVVVPDGESMVNLNFWFSLAVGLSIFAVFSTPQFRTQQSEYAALALRNVGIHSVPPYLGTVWLVCGILACVEWVCSFFATEGTARIGAFFARFGSIFAWALIAVAVANLFVRPTEMDALPEAVPHWEFHVGRARAVPPADADFARPPLPTPKHYAATAVKAVGSSVGIGYHDYLIEKLFWLAGGSIETAAPNWILSCLMALMVAGLAGLFFRIAATRNSPRLLQVLFTLAGLALCLILTAVGSIVSPANPSLHGRYLIGFHVTWLLVSLIGFKSPVLFVQWRKPVWFATGCIACMLAIHGSCYWIELDRYF